MKCFKMFLIVFAGGLLFAPLAEFKIIGYVPDWAGTPSYVQWDKVTHVNYAFVLPTNGTGSIGSPNNSILNYLVTQAHNNGVKVLVSIGGWNNGNDQNFHTVAASSSAIATFTANCVNMVTQYNLDGIDIDWEYPDAGTSADQYVTLMTSLSTAMHTRGKLLTAAVSGSANNGVKNAVFDLVDFLNIMSYDGGTPHSPYTMAVSDLHSWRARGLSKDKAILGVPFYGRDPYTSYKDLVASDAQAPFKDQVGTVYYNGIATIQRKTQLAMDSGGGIMIWELSQDVSGANSLLKAIYDKSRATPIDFDRRSPLSLDAAPFQMPDFPVVFRSNTIVKLLLKRTALVRIDVVDVKGRVVCVVRDAGPMQAGMNMIAWATTTASSASLAAGLYYYRLAINLDAGWQTAVRPMLILR
jgi:GH18 family chitinase